MSDAHSGLELGWQYFGDRTELTGDNRSRLPAFRRDTGRVAVCRRLRIEPQSELDRLIRLDVNLSAPPGRPLKNQDFTQWIASS
jgi:hypothetical protein